MLKITEVIQKCTGMNGRFSPVMGYRQFFLDCRLLRVVFPCGARRPYSKISYLRAEIRIMGAWSGPRFDRTPGATMRT